MIGIWNPVINDTWIRRIPVEEGVRTGEKLLNLSDLSNGNIYAHGLIFTVNTISHVAIGDVTAVTID